MPRQKTKELEKLCPECREANIVRVTTTFDEPFPEDAGVSYIREVLACKKGCGYHEVIKDDLHEAIFERSYALAHS